MDNHEGEVMMPEPITMSIILAVKWVAGHAAATTAGHAATAHIAAGHIAAGHIAAGHAATVHLAAGHAAAAHLAAPAAIAGTTLAASTLGGVTFIDVFKRLADDVHEEVDNGQRPWPSSEEWHEIVDIAYENAREQLQARGYLLTAADRNEMDSLKTKIDYATAA
jgi:hypothetical protein